MWGSFFFIYFGDMEHHHPEIPVLLTTSYFPPVRYFTMLCQHTTALIEHHETYAKQSFRNRCEILTGNGVLRLTVPVTLPGGNHTRVDKVTITDDDPWRVKHWRAIESAYNKSPYFLYYRDSIETVLFDKSVTLLIDLNTRLLEEIMNSIGLETKLERTSNYKARLEEKIDARKMTGRGYKPGVRANFPGYAQVFNERFPFRPDLSILDLLFNVGPGTLDYLWSVKLSPGSYSG